MGGPPPGMSRGRVLEIPGPAVVLLIGAAGSGKSTFAARWFPAGAIISSDALRAEITGDVEDQTANARVFAAVHQALDRRLATGLGSLIDATNLIGSGRRAIRERGTRAGIPVFAIVFSLPADLVQHRNATRDGRRVPASVVARHLAAAEALLRRGSLEREGYERIVVLRDPEDVAGLEVVLPDAAADWIR